jgi:hypothetical protein
MLIFVGIEKKLVSPPKSSLPRIFKWRKTGAREAITAISLACMPKIFEPMLKDDSVQKWMSKLKEKAGLKKKKLSGLVV